MQGDSTKRAPSPAPKPSQPSGTETVQQPGEKTPSTGNPSGRDR